MATPSSDTPSSSPTGGAGSMRPIRRKQRGWVFKIDGIANHDMTEEDLFFAVRERYTTVKRLALKNAAPGPASEAAEPASKSTHDEVGFQAAAAGGVLVEIQFAGPQPSEGCGALLCHLLRGTSVEARPVELPRGRKKNTATRYDAVAATADGHVFSGYGGSMLLPPHQGFDDQGLPFPGMQHQLGGHPSYSGSGEGQHSLSSTGHGFGGAGMVEERRLPIEGVVVALARKECDFEGRPLPGGGSGMTPSSTVSSNGRDTHVVFTGLNNTGHDPRGLRVTVIFGVDAVHQIACVTSPIQVAADGRAYSRVFYPSLEEVWPELYYTVDVRAVEVDVAVEILSDDGREFRYVGPHLKVGYTRITPPAGAMGMIPAAFSASSGNPSAGMRQPGFPGGAASAEQQQQWQQQQQQWQQQQQQQAWWQQQQQRGL
ncbi:unnamed protein product [Ectocarpus sp. 12 AP-2014]